MSVRSKHSPLRDRIARLGDLFIACALISITFPLIVIVALAIKLESPGPVLTRRERTVGSRRSSIPDAQIPYRKMRTTAGK